MNTAMIVVNICYPFPDVSRKTATAIYILLRNDALVSLALIIQYRKSKKRVENCFIRLPFRLKSMHTV